jgi:CheY-like chemotaxis protein
MTPPALMNEQAPVERGPQFRRVLLVEDEVPLRTVIARNLTSRGIQVCEAGTASDAVAAATTEHHDLLLLDINRLRLYWRMPCSQPGLEGRQSR